MSPLEVLGGIALTCVAGAACLVGLAAADELAERRRGRRGMPHVLARLDAHARALQRLERHQTPGNGPRTRSGAVSAPQPQHRHLSVVPALSVEAPDWWPPMAPRGARPPSIGPYDQGA